MCDFNKNVNILLNFNNTLLQCKIPLYIQRYVCTYICTHNKKYFFYEIIPYKNKKIVRERDLYWSRTLRGFKKVKIR